MFFICSAGSNIDPSRNLGTALLHATRRVAPLAVAAVARTEPVAMDSEREFLNTVFLLFSPHTPERVKADFRAIEALLGRDIHHPRRSRMDRPIDLDILYAGVYRPPGTVHLQEPYVRVCLPGGADEGVEREVIDVDGVPVGERPVWLHPDPRPGRIRTGPMPPLCRQWLVG